MRYLAHQKQLDALELIPQVAAEFKEIFGRNSGGLVDSYCIDDADTVVVAMGSILGTLKDTIDERRADGEKVGALAIRSFRPFPTDEIVKNLANAKKDRA